MSRRTDDGPTFHPRTLKNSTQTEIMSSGDGRMGDPPDLEFETEGRLQAQAAIAIDLAAWVAYLRITNGGPPAPYFDGEVRPEITDDGPDYAVFADVVRVEARDDGFTIKHLPSSLSYEVNFVPFKGDEVISISMIDYCDDCGKRHAGDWAAFARLDSAGYFMESWIQGRS